MLPNKYASTRNKERVRQEDTKLIEQEFSRKGRKLSYLGMPSGEMKDILTWAEYIDSCTAVEIDEVQRRKLALNLMKYNLEGCTRILFGDIEDILIAGVDNFGNALNYTYDVVFLDFFGTILYKDLKRVKAINCLFEKQKGHSFLLLLTFNIKQKKYSHHAIERIFDKIKKELYGFYLYDESITGTLKDIIDRYKSNETHEMYRQKLFVPFFVKTRGENSGFKTHCYPPIFYLGFNKSPMIHFAFKLTSELASPTRAVSEQTIIDIINLNVKQAERGRVKVRDKQMPQLKP